MYLYYNSLIIIMLSAFFLNFLSPTADFSKKFMRPVCGLMLLVVLLSPLPSLSDNADFDFNLSRASDTTAREKFTSEAYTIFAYLSGNSDCCRMFPETVLKMRMWYPASSGQPLSYGHKTVMFL